MSETEQHEKAIAQAWHDKRYTRDEAMLMAELQGLSYLNIIEQFKTIEYDTEVEINGI